MMSVAEVVAESRFEDALRWPEGSLMNQVAILGERDGGLIEAMVPVHLINREEVPVDQVHVQELLDDMDRIAGDKGGSGQVSAIVLAEVKGEDTFRISDGFHRDSALHKRGESVIYSTIMLDRTVEQVRDYRILTANLHSSVKFARITEWIGDAWADTPWGSRLSVLQAFGVNQTKATEAGKNLGISRAEALAIKTWVRDKSRQWRMSPASIYIDLMTADVADPELVASVRSRAGGRSLDNLTPQHLQVIATAFPREYGMQRIADQLARRHTMTVDLTRTMTEILSKATNLQTATSIVQQVDWTRIKPIKKTARAAEAHASTISPASRPAAAEQSNGHAPHIGRATLSRMTISLVAGDLRYGRTAIENLVHRKLYTAPEVQQEATRVFGIHPVTDRLINSLVVTDNSASHVSGFLSTVGAARMNLEGQLQERHHLDSNVALDIIETASNRVVHAMESGELRFAAITSGIDFSSVLVRCINDEVDRRKGRNGTKAVASQPKSTEVIPFTALVGAVPEMEDEVRFVTSLHGVLGLSAVTTSNIIQKPLRDTKYMLDEGHQLLKQAAAAE
jgi:hypothetical protein